MQILYSFPPLNCSYFGVIRNLPKVTTSTITHLAIDLHLPLWPSGQQTCLGTQDVGSILGTGRYIVARMTT